MELHLFGSNSSPTPVKNTANPTPVKPATNKAKPDAIPAIPADSTNPPLSGILCLLYPKTDIICRLGDVAAHPRWVSLGLKWTMFYVYILQSEKTLKLYKGSTSDLKRRLHEHNSGKTKSTRNNGEWKLIYYEAFLNKKDALIEERFLKTGKGRDRIKYLLKNTIR